MARNTLEAVFGALGAGLTGFGRERQQRTEDEERRKREALQESLTAANMLASGRFGTEAQLQASGGQAFRTAGQLAAGAMGGVPRRVIPTADDLSNLGTASRRGPAPAMFEVGGQRLGVMRTAADEAREAANRELQAGALERQARREDFATEQKVIGERELAGIRARAASDRGTQASATAAAERAELADLRRRASADFTSAAREGVVVPGNIENRGQESKRPLTTEERTALRTQIYADYGLNPDGTRLGEADETESIKQWMRNNPRRPNERQEDYRARYNASRSGR